jgi:hypothetical protein
MSRQMVRRVSLRRVVAVATVLGVLIPIVLLVRTLVLGRLFGSTLELLLYPGSIFLFDQSRHSSLYGLTAFGLSLTATVALYAFTAMILFGIFRGVVGAWRFVRRR